MTSSTRAPRVPWRCPNCGLHAKMPAGKTILCRCSVQSEAIEGPGLVQQVSNFAKAAAAHVAAGSPQVTESMQAWRLGICQRCRYYSGEICLDHRCGCPLSQQREWRSKLAWADQQCPQGKWGPAPPGLEADGSGPQIRLAILTPCLNFGGGVEQWIHSLVKYLPPDIARAGIAITTTTYDAQALEYLQPYTPVSIGGDMARLLAANSDVLLCWGGDDPRQLIGPGREARTIYTAHGQSDWSAATAAQAQQWASTLVAVSPASQAISPPGTRLINNGVDFSRLLRLPDRDAARRQLGVPTGAFVLGTLGRIVPDKDPSCAARGVGELGTGSWALLVGRGEQDLIDQARRAANGRFTHQGATQDVASVLAAVDVLVTGSRHEGFGLALAEAWAAGVPTVSTRVGIAEKHPYAVEIPHLAAGAAVSKAARWARGPGHREQVREAKRMIETEYSAERMAAQWAELIREVAAHAARTV